MIKKYARTVGKSVQIGGANGEIDTAQTASSSAVNVVSKIGIWSNATSALKQFVKNAYLNVLVLMGLVVLVVRVID